MKKTLLTAAALISLAGLAFSDVKLSGYVRGGASVTLDDPSVDENTYSSATWMGGDYFGGGSRQRLVLDASFENCGVLMRYQHDGYSDYFADGSISWLMGYASFCDGKVIAEAGKINDRFTWTGGFQDSAFDWWGRGKGAALVVKPVEGLVIEADVTDLFTSEVTKGEAKATKADADLLQVSAKYGTDSFFVTGGFAPAGYYFGSFGLMSVENLYATVELFGETKDGNCYSNGGWAGYVSDTYNDITVFLDYSGIDKTELALVAEATILDDCTKLKINPAVGYDLSDIIKLTADVTVNLPASWDEDKLGAKPDTYATITPGVTFKASKAASATVWATISTDTDQAQNKLGAGVKLSY
ncbi:MAG: hypothetical protein KBT11_10470 [Treponema sp.]|nr:hypothetical protein [Candidatus Treponema equifaecale]